MKKDRRQNLKALKLRGKTFPEARKKKEKRKFKGRQKSS